MKFCLIHAKKASTSVAFMCHQLGVSRSGYYAWAKSPESLHQKSDRELTVEVASTIYSSEKKSESTRLSS